MKIVLFNPFEKFSASKLLVFGIIATLIGSYLGYVFNGRFDGVIDLHFNEETTLVQPFIDNAINILCLSVSLFVVGRIINKKTRFIDVLIPAMIARIPFYFLTLTNINNFMITFSNEILENLDLKNPEKFHLEPVNLITMLLSAIVSIGMLVLFVILLFRGFKTATNCRTPNHTLLFVVGIILAEILSKVIIYFTNY